MTDAEADAWLVDKAQYTSGLQGGMVLYQLWRSGGSPDERVGIAFPEGYPPPDGKDVHRFLVRWFVSVYGA